MEAVIAQMAINDNDGRPPFFVSHSGADRDIVDIILGVFEFHNQHHRRRRHPIRVNRELLSQSTAPHWEQIRDLIHQSDGVFLILTQGILEQEHTQNWVAFEVGVAAGHNPSIPVIAVRGEGVTIPLPYLTHSPQFVLIIVQRRGKD
jgi:hypothetical protein